LAPPFLRLHIGVIWKFQFVMHRESRSKEEELPEIYPSATRPSIPLKDPPLSFPPHGGLGFVGIKFD
jgi:hypothetical protein